MAEALAAELTARRWRVTAAESCTGGLISAAFTDIPGSSSWFDMSFVVYSNQAKQQLLGVSAALLESCGAVSEAVVRAMAKGALDRSGADISVAVSGIAGPDGGTVAKPVGTVWFAWARRDGICHAKCHSLMGDRTAIRRQAVELALQGLLQLLHGDCTD